MYNGAMIPDTPVPFATLTVPQQRQMAAITSSSTKRLTEQAVQGAYKMEGTDPASTFQLKIYPGDEARRLLSRLAGEKKGQPMSERRACKLSEWAANLFSLGILSAKKGQTKADVRQEFIQNLSRGGAVRTQALTVLFAATVNYVTTQAQVGNRPWFLPRQIDQLGDVSEQEGFLINLDHWDKNEKRWAASDLRKKSWTLSRAEMGYLLAVCLESLPPEVLIAGAQHCKQKALPTSGVSQLFIQRVDDLYPHGTDIKMAGSIGVCRWPARVMVAFPGLGNCWGRTGQPGNVPGRDTGRDTGRGGWQQGPGRPGVDRTRPRSGGPTLFDNIPNKGDRGRDR